MEIGTAAAGRSVASAAVLWAAAALLALAAAGLATAGAVSWRRTGALRRALARQGGGAGSRGQSTRVDGSSVPRVQGRWRTSRATFLAAAAGGALGLGGLALALPGRGPPRLGPTVSVLGACIALGGLAARVTALEIDRTGLVVRYRLRRPFVLPWTACTAVRPPRWPLGGWRLVGVAGGRILMPSDLLGLEVVLSVLAERAGLATPARASPTARRRDGGPGAPRGPGRGASRPPPLRPGR